MIQLEVRGLRAGSRSIEGGAAGIGPVPTAGARSIVDAAEMDDAFGRPTHQARRPGPGAKPALGRTGPGSGSGRGTPPNVARENGTCRFLESGPSLCRAIAVCSSSTRARSVVSQVLVGQ